MNLDKDREVFSQAIVQTAEYLQINPAIVEKDYYVTKMLKNLVDEEENIVFKGGTSLSKCYKLIQRFSEDIDLNYDNSGEKLTEGMRKKFSKLVKDIGYKLDMNLVNEAEIRSRRDFNRYSFQYPSEYAMESMNPFLIVETAIAIKSFPTEQLEADSFIYQFLLENNLNDLINQYQMKPFIVNVQSKERTFVDKVFAICDYYLSDNIKEHSRHLYDLYKLYPEISFGSEFEQLVKEVREVRKTSKVCLSAQDEISVKQKLREIVDRNIYQEDYQLITKDLLFESIDYDEIIEVLNKLIQMDMWN